MKQASWWVVVCVAVLGRLVAAPAGYYDEPANLPFAETVREVKVETGWKWMSFRYTSIVYGGQPMRIHAVYAVPDTASAIHKVPVIVMTHGKFGQALMVDARFPTGSEPGKPVNPTVIAGFSGGGFGPPRRTDPRYLDAIRDLVAAGYAVMYFEWNPDPAMKEGPLPAGAPEPAYSTFGSLDYSKEWNPPGNDWRDCIFYQAMMAGRRAITWVSAQPEVDATRIGATGASYGGIFSSLLAAIDPRIKAVAPTVYAAGFDIGETGYNNLSSKRFTPEQAAEWKSRFDSEVLLAARTKPLPILYSVATNDSAFTIPKAARHYAALPEPKQILIAPNQGHGFWNFPQTIRFFDRELKGKGTRPAVSAIAWSGNAEAGWGLSVVSDAPSVEFYYALEPLHDLTVRADRRVQPDKWKWEKLTTARVSGAGAYAATLELTAEVCAGTEAVHVFARARDAAGVEACSPLVTRVLADRLR